MNEADKVPALMELKFQWVKKNRKMTELLVVQVLLRQQCDEGHLRNGLKVILLDRAGQKRPEY